MRTAKTKQLLHFSKICSFLPQNNEAQVIQLSCWIYYSWFKCLSVNHPCCFVAVNYIIKFFFSSADFLVYNHPKKFPFHFFHSLFPSFINSLQHFVTSKGLNPEAHLWIWKTPNFQILAFNIHVSEKANSRLQTLYNGYGPRGVCNHNIRFSDIVHRLQFFPLSKLAKSIPKASKCRKPQNWIDCVHQKIQISCKAAKQEVTSNLCNALIYALTQTWSQNFISSEQNSGIWSLDPQTKAIS